jgi:hypothetical protein
MQPAEAHGNDRTIYLSNVPVGSYTLDVWTSPAVLRAGEIHVEIALFDQGGEPVQNALAYVTMTPLDGMGEPSSVLAYRTEGASQEAAFRVDQPGRCRVEIRIAGVDGEQGHAAFEVEVIRVPTLIQALFYIQILASLVAGIWIMKMGIIVWLRPVLRNVTAVS